MPCFRLEWSTVSPGIIQYQWQELKGNEVDPAKIVAGVEAAKYVWVDMTQSNMEMYGQAINNGSRKYVGLAETLYRTQTVTGVVVEAVGHAAMTYLSPGLSAKTNTTLTFGTNVVFGNLGDLAGLATTLLQGNFLIVFAALNPAFFSRDAKP